MKGKRTSLKKVLEPYCWLLPAFALFIPFTFLPFLQTVYKSFFIVDSMGTLKRFVGFENYLYILKDVFLRLFARSDRSIPSIFETGTVKIT